MSLDELISFFLKNPKIIAAIMILIVIVLVLTMFGGGNSNSDLDYSNTNYYEKNIFGVTFHIPEGFKESYHSGPSSSGETVDFQSEEYDDLEIEVSPYYNVNLNSKHVKVKYSKNIGGMDGTLVFYDSNRVSFYYKYGDYLIKLNTNSPDHDELFAHVIV